ncbi:hypothetical protein [Pectobacterium versatile]|uniref:hypothetical protein n=1 Tax=Pectobacterium versatile TaxID=2488639 RepID=UPI001CE2017B|nr:hypothetical protein [Pectobacterium versatile]MCA5933305.1 hypothetical protein [Pectobacterium versatile]MCA5950588.1 hypothetical protein [Pectobacterium versatile]MCA5954831.1 hypothetical protein [Pectobacterium versatile]UCP88334.1 hypothetical protein LGL96_22485 [Pectobacterium versatile]
MTTDVSVPNPAASSQWLVRCSLLLRDKAKQVQDITTLRRNVEHANNALSPIFKKEN